MPLDSYAALRNPTVRRYTIGRLLFSFGSQMQSTAVGWQLYERTGSALALGLTGLVAVVPALVLALPAGHVVDRHERRLVAMAAQIILFAVALGLALFSSLLSPGAPVWPIYVLLFASGVGTAFAAPATSAILPQLVPLGELTNANAWLSSGRQLAAMAGPAVAGGLIALTGGTVAVYGIEALASLVFVVTLATLPSRARVAPPVAAPVPADPVVVSASGHGAGGLSDVFSGLRFVWRNEVFLAAITLDLFAVLLGGATALLPIFARDLLHVGPTGLGLLRAAPSLGAFAMALATTRLPPWERPGRVLLYTVAGFGLATIGFGLSRNFALSFVLLALTGLFDNISVVIRITLEQVLTPDDMRGRVGAIHWVFIGLSNEMGAFESGATAALFGPVASVVGGGIGTLLVVALAASFWPALGRLARLGGPVSH